MIVFYESTFSIDNHKWYHDDSHGGLRNNISGFKKAFRRKIKSYNFFPNIYIIEFMLETLL